MEALNWIIDHRAELIEIAGLLYLLLSLGVKLTPTPVDDTWLRRISERLSFLAPWGTGRVFSVPGRDPYIETARKGGGSGGAMALAMLAALPMASGCGGGALSAIRSTAATSTVAVMAADGIVADAYERAIDSHREGSLTDESFADRVGRLDRAERALRTTVDALQALDFALQAAEDGRQCGLAAAVPAMVGAVSELIAALDSAGLDVPDVIQQLIPIAQALSGLAGECES